MSVCVLYSIPMSGKSSESFVRRCDEFHTAYVRAKSLWHVGTCSSYSPIHQPIFLVTVDINGPSDKIYSFSTVLSRGSYRRTHQVYSRSVMIEDMDEECNGVWAHIPIHRDHAYPGRPQTLEITK